MQVFWFDPLELGELVDIRAHFARKLAFVRRAFHAHDDALAIHRIHHAGALVQSTTAPESRAVTRSMPVPT